MNNKPLRILVTGGAGQLGSALVHRLLKLDTVSVVAVDNFLTGRPELLPENSDKFRFVNADCNNALEISQVMLGSCFDFVFHYAAVVGVKRTTDNPIMVLNDITGLENILRLCKNTGVKRVFFSSSSEVYGEPVEIPQREDMTPLNSKLPYAVVKNIGECYLRSYHREYGLEYTIFRFFNTYGPNQSYDFVVPKLLINAMYGQDLTIYGDGSQTRTFCYADDNVDACINCMLNHIHVNDTINIGSETMYTILELAETIKAITGSQSNIVHLPPLAEGDMTRRQPDASKMIEALSRTPVTLEEGIQKMLADPSFASYSEKVAKGFQWI